jgi:hypothetical protein
MFISIDAEKTLDKIQHPLMIKILNKLVTERMYLNTKKATGDKHTSNTIMN